MKKILTSTSIPLILLFINGIIYGQKNTLQVEITGFEKQESSKIFVSVFKEKDFLEKSIETKSLTVSGDKVAVSFNLPPGEYAVSTYHDLNNNRELDRRFYGKPKEPYGFSNNVRPLGKPSFDKCRFVLKDELKIVPIKLIK